MRIKTFFIVFIYFFSHFSIAAELKIATTTSTKGSGLLDLIIPAFEKESGYKVNVSSVGTGTALRMGRQGKVDLILVHAPAAEKKFVSDGFGILRTPVMENNFIIAGPQDDPAKIANLKTSDMAFSKIHNKQSLFMSRGDDSGTHKKEMNIWNNCNVIPYGDWYYESGAGMSATLLLASRKKAYLLVDKGTWLAKRKSTKLVSYINNDPSLINPYHVIAVNPKKYNHVNLYASKSFIKWITGKQGQAIISNLRIDGEKLFTATAQ